MDFYSLPGAGCEDMNILSVCYQIKLYLFPSLSSMPVFILKAVDPMRNFCRKLNSHHLHFSVLDTNDRFLRKITVGQASTEKGQIREVCSIHTFTILTNLIRCQSFHHLALFVYFYNNQNIYWCGILVSINLNMFHSSSFSSLNIFSFENTVTQNYKQ